jgi:hypothetical protein
MFFGKIILSSRDRRGLEGQTGEAAYGFLASFLPSVPTSISGEFLVYPR